MKNFIFSMYVLMVSVSVSFSSTTIVDTFFTGEYKLCEGVLSSEKNLSPTFAYFSKMNKYAKDSLTGYGEITFYENLTMGGHLCCPLYLDESGTFWSESTWTTAGSIDTKSYRINDTLNYQMLVVKKDIIQIQSSKFVVPNQNTTWTGTYVFTTHIKNCCIPSTGIGGSGGDLLVNKYNHNILIGAVIDVSVLQGLQLYNLDAQQKTKSQIGKLNFSLKDISSIDSIVIKDDGTILANNRANGNILLNVNISAIPFDSIDSFKVQFNNSNITVSWKLIQNDTSDGVVAQLYIGCDSLSMLPISINLSEASINFCDTILKSELTYLQVKTKNSIGLTNQSNVLTVSKPKTSILNHSFKMIKVTKLTNMGFDLSGRKINKMSTNKMFLMSNKKILIVK